MFQGDSVAVGEERYYHEDGAVIKVGVKDKVVKGEMMTLTLTVLEVVNGPFHGADSPEVGHDIVVMERENAGIYAGWSISREL